MKSVRDILCDADPLRYEPHRLDGERARIRQAVRAAASDITTASPAAPRRPVAILVAFALIIAGVLAVGSGIWSRGGTTLQAAIRFEVRLAENHPAAGLQEARVAGSDRLVYLHEEVIATNGDLAQSRVVEGSAPSRFGVVVQFDPAGTRKMRQATADHIGRPVAILIDGHVAAAPVLRSPIGASAVITGDYTRAEAEKIVSGLSIR